MATVLTDRTRFLLDEDQIPRAWYNIAADLPSPPPPPLHPGTGQPIGPGDLAPLFPMELIKQVVIDRPGDRDPGARPRGIQALPAEPALSGAPAREGARDAGPHLLQVRGRQPVGQPQAEHRPGAGVLQQGRGRDPPRDRDRSRAVGERAGLRGRRLRARDQGLHGPGELRPEAVPADPDGDLRRAGRASPSPDTKYGRRMLAETPDHRDRWASRSARRSRTRSPPGDTVLPRVGASTSCSSTRR